MGLSTLTTTVWDIMYNHLQTGTYAISTNNIFSAWNDDLIKDKGFPIVVIEAPRYSISKFTKNGSVLRCFITFNIECYHKTAAACKVLCDEIQTKLITGYSVFATAGLKRTIDEDWFSVLDYDSWSYADKHKIHRYTLTVNFNYIETI